MPPLTPHSCQAAAAATKLAAAANAVLLPSCRLHRQADRYRQRHALDKLAATANAATTVPIISIVIVVTSVAVTITAFS